MPSIWTLGQDQPVIPGVPFSRLATALPHATAGSVRRGPRGDGMITDLYLAEAERIATAQRELNARFHYLVDTVRAERPDLFHGELSAFAFKPPATKAEHFGVFIQGHDAEVAWLRSNR